MLAVVLALAMGCQTTPMVEQVTYSTGFFNPNTNAPLPEYLESMSCLEVRDFYLQMAHLYLFSAERLAHAKTPKSKELWLQLKKMAFNLHPLLTEAQARKCKPL